VLRNALLGIGFIVAAVVAINLLYTSDRERVEEETLRLFELAREGGEDAANEILDAFADDYRGQGLFSKRSIERRLRLALVPAGTATDIKHGGFDTLVKDDEIVIPLIHVQATVGGGPARVFLIITWGSRGGRWKIVDISQWRAGR
jgi:hypothetical protein